jgi:hypothetical protein
MSIRSASAEGTSRPRWEAWRTAIISGGDHDERSVDQREFSTSRRPLASAHAAFPQHAVTKEYESSWIFERCLTWANALQPVQHPAFSLVNVNVRQRASTRLILVTMRSFQWWVGDGLPVIEGDTQQGPGQTAGALLVRGSAVVAVLAALLPAPALRPLGRAGLAQPLGRRSSRARSPSRTSPRVAARAWAGG